MGFVPRGPSSMLLVSGLLTLSLPMFVHYVHVGMLLENDGNQLI